MEDFLRKVEADLLKAIEIPLGYSNLSKREWDAIRSLADDRNIVIRISDKGFCVVIWDRNDYVKEAEIQLSNQNVYKSVEFKDKILSELVEKSNHFFKSLKARGIISEKELQHFTYKYKKTTSLGKMYLLPKIHKRLYDVPGRPVISNCGTPTEKVSEFLDHHLKPVMQEGDSYIKDTGDFLNKIKNINAIPENAILVTADVVGLYPSIPHQAGLEALREALDKRKTHKVPTSKLIKMAEFVLKNNYFQFSDKVYQQISGTAIGTKFAPPYACIFMDQVESKFLQTQKFQPLVWFRYIDDIFFIWTHGERSLKNPNIKFAYEFSEASINFLDLNVKFSSGKLQTSLYVKPTDCHQYLHFQSSHPKHTKKSIVYSQTLRVSRACSQEEDYKNYCNQMKSWFLKRSYPEHLIDTEMQKVKFKSREKTEKSKLKGVTFVVTYHPSLNCLQKIIRDNTYLFYMNEEVKNLFLPGSMVSFRGAHRLSSYLVRAKLYPLHRKVGSKKCAKNRCGPCDYVTDTDIFASTVTGESFKINHQLNYDDRCIIYLLTCK